MGLEYLLVVFIVLIIILSTLRQQLVYEISGTSLLILGTTRPGVIFYSLIFLPGTIIHELSHWIVAEILQVKTGKITIFPDDTGGGESHRLGSVATQKSDPVHGFLIGIAPFISGLGILVVLGQLLTSVWGNNLWWQLVLLIYGIVVIGNSMMISREDRRTWPFILIFITLITIVLYRLQLAIPSSIYNLASNVLSTLNLILGVTAGFNLVMIGGSYGLRRLVEHLTNQRITKR
jgi:hypothetical protein